MALARIDIEDLPFKAVTEGVLKRWIAFENTIRNELVKVRAGRLGRQEEDYIRWEPGFDADVPAMLRQVTDDPSPLRIEINLIEIRWQFLTNLELGHDYDFASLLVYSLKLQLLERLARLDFEKGQQVLNLIYETNFNGR